MIRDYISNFWRHYRMILAVFALTVFALLLRIVYHYLEPSLSRDSITYLNLLNRWQESGNYSDAFCGNLNRLPPLAFFLPRILMALGFSADIAGLSINIVLGTLLVPLIYCLTRILSSPAVALTAAALMSCHPVAIDLSIQIQRDIPYLFFCGLFAVFFLKGLQISSYFRWGACGVFFIMAALTRYEALEFAIIVPGILFFKSLYFPSNWRKNLIAATIFAGAAGITLLLLLLLMGVNMAFLSTYWDFCTREILQQEYF